MTESHFTYIHKKVRFEWDSNKNAHNKFKHDLEFEHVLEFDWDNAIILDRSRSADGEHRYAAVNIYEEKFHTIIFTKRNSVTRIISFRRSNPSEEKNYEKARIETAQRL